MVELIFTPKFYLIEDHEAAKAEKIVLHRKHFSELLVDEGIDSTNFCGLVNEGTTCYVNSLL
jgi:ubiquitin C-terminal hydrolase